MSEDLSLACDLTAIPASEREEHLVTAPRLFETAQEVQELPNGFAIRFPGEPGKFMEIAKFIDSERLCCPFFDFSVEVEPNQGPLWLRLTGGEGVKELLRATFFDGIADREALKQTIHTGGDAHLDEVVAQTPLPILNGVLRSTPPG
jgi:hypothetical protein